MRLVTGVTSSWWTNSSPARIRVIGPGTTVVSCVFAVAPRTGLDQVAMTRRPRGVRSRITAVRADRPRPAQTEHLRLHGHSRAV